MEEIINYIMETPENVNGNILREKLKEFKGSGGSSGGVLVVTVAPTVAPVENGASSGGTKRSDPGDEPIYIADKTVAEIRAGLLAGNVVVRFVDHEFINANDIYAVISVE